MGGGDGRMARSDHHVMQILDYVTNGVDAVYSYSLMHVRIQASDITMPRAQSARASSQATSMRHR